MGRSRALTAHAADHAVESATLQTAERPPLRQRLREHESAWAQFAPTAIAVAIGVLVPLSGFNPLNNIPARLGVESHFPLVIFTPAVLLALFGLLVRRWLPLVTAPRLGRTGIAATGALAVA